MPDLARGQITKANKKHSGKFTPKYRASSILQKKIEDVVSKSTKIWKLIYGLTTVKDGEEDPLEGQNTEQEDKVEPSEKEKVEEKVTKKGEEEKKEEEKKDEEEKEKGEEEETQRQDEMATVEQEKQQDQSVQDTQLPPPSPPHVTITPIDTITVKDVSDTFSQNINPLTTKDLKNILDQSTQQEKLCKNLVLVSVDELQKVVADTTRDKVNPQEKPSLISTATSAQIQMQTIVTSGKFDTIV